MGVIENMKDIADLIKKAGDVELYRKIVESEGEVIELTRANRGLENKVRELGEMLALQKEMKFKEPFWWQDGDNTPYCPACWEAHKTAVHVTFIFDNEDATRWDCPSCKHMYLIKKRKSRPANFGYPGRPGPDSWME